MTPMSMNPTRIEDDTDIEMSASSDSDQSNENNVEKDEEPTTNFEYEIVDI